ncbi:hypothetical protein CDL15_Pgr011280 [Punica granatum]|uniref:DUF789 domain-containing protein n=1 Tax=Punica granatum TaxID=22663 RepID=A0A218WF31_PUNGR|nr:hypothetical protein CDL15_Pgr011280 [Punica granatum]
MPGSGRVSVARSRRGENRFYCPPALRKQQADSRSPDAGAQTEKNACPVSESDESLSLCSVSGKAESGCDSSNLDRFLESTTPRVPVQCLPKTSLGRWRTSEADYHPYFMLGDLWDSFREWSAYGAGVPLLLNGSVSVVQYYVPYLSGIQLYRDPSRSFPQRRRPGEESDTDSSRETSSNGSIEVGLFRGANGTLHGVYKQPTEIDVQRFNGLSLKDRPSCDSSSDEAEIPNPPGQLLFEYLERDPPYSREPLVDKISMLASKFPELWTYRSCDLSSSSWISVAWLCFRSSPDKSNEGLPLNGMSMRDVHETSSKLALTTFGLASYKFKISVWNPSGVEECPKANSLFRAADNWLRLLQVHHPDFSFFVSHSTYWR